jgi:hypothetical protein
MGSRSQGLPGYEESSTTICNVRWPAKNPLIEQLRQSRAAPELAQVMSAILFLISN